MPLHMVVDRCSCIVVNCRKLRFGRSDICRTRRTYRIYMAFPGRHGPARPSPWTKARLRHLRRRWKQGARAREIGAELGVSANAVIAKIHRLGIARLSPYGGAPGRRLALRRIPAADRPHDARRRAFAFRRARAAPALPKSERCAENARADAQIPLGQRRSLFALGDDSCRWPVGDPVSAGFFFCGAQAVRNKPYCAAHCARAYRRPRARTRDARAPRERQGVTLSTAATLSASRSPHPGSLVFASLRRALRPSPSRGG